VDLKLDRKFLVTEEGELVSNLDSENTGTGVEISEFTKPVDETKVKPQQKKKVMVAADIAPPEEDFAYLPDLDEDDYKDYLNSDDE
jgi:hypothetical protein